jgi:hypothetical protein
MTLGDVDTASAGLSCRRLERRAGGRGVSAGTPAGKAGGPVRRWPGLSGRRWERWDWTPGAARSDWTQSGCETSWTQYEVLLMH